MLCPIRTLALLLVAAATGGCAVANRPVSLYGDPAPVAAAERTIAIRPDTRYVNVEGGQIVAFVSGDKKFAWNFMVASGISSFQLNDVAPPGTLDHPVTAYVSPDPRYIGDGDGRGR